MSRSSLNLCGPPPLFMVIRGSSAQALSTEAAAKSQDIEFQIPQAHSSRCARDGGSELDTLANMVTRSAKTQCAFTLDLAVSTTTPVELRQQMRRIANGSARISTFPRRAPNVWCAA
ncbi:hypothetical protein B0H13DRAFT_1902020 [Mycena leptocephala]|nr:hypothetical protein B0H13DRAFT_1902020 [Mycena leptocephala]